MEIDIISQYVLSIAPAAAALFGCVGAAAVCIHRVKKVCKDSEENIARARKEASRGKTAEDLRKENEDLRRDNARLKEDNRLLMCKIKHVRFTEDPEGEE